MPHFKCSIWFPPYIFVNVRALNIVLSSIGDENDVPPQLFSYFYVGFFTINYSLINYFLFLSLPHKLGYSPYYFILKFEATSHPMARRKNSASIFLLFPTENISVAGQNVEPVLMLSIMIAYSQFDKN